MLIPCNSQWAPWILAHRLRFFSCMSVYTLLLRSAFFWLASRALSLISLYNFAGLVPRELMFEGHVTFERIFQNIVKLRNFVDHRVPLHFNRTTRFYLTTHFVLKHPHLILKETPHDLTKYRTLNQPTSPSCTLIKT